MTNNTLYRKLLPAVKKFKDTFPNCTAKRNEIEWLLLQGMMMQNNETERQLLKGKKKY